jgi:hypothetical protein
MRNILIIGLVSLLTACGERAEPGTPLAARFLAAKFVGEAHMADPVVVRDEPVINGDTATVKTEFGKNKGCTVELVRSDSEKEYGWLVKAIACAQD